MIHARPDYNRIQDPENLIPEDEPVFLLRGQDTFTPYVIEVWARCLDAQAGEETELANMAYKHAELIREYQRNNKCKIPDITEEQLANNDGGK